MLRNYTLANLRTLENKISDAGPTNQRIDPHVLTVAKKELTDAGEVKMYSPIPGKNDIPWFYLTGTPELDLKNRYDELEPIHRATEDRSFTKRIGQTMEIAVSRALQERADLYSTGHYIDLNEHSDDKPYSKDEPPSIVGNLAIRDGDSLVGEGYFVVRRALVGDPASRARFVDHRFPNAFRFENEFHRLADRTTASPRLGDIVRYFFDLGNRIPHCHGQTRASHHRKIWKVVAHIRDGRVRDLSLLKNFLISPNF